VEVSLRRKYFFCDEQQVWSHKVKYTLIRVYTRAEIYRVEFSFVIAVWYNTEDQWGKIYVTLLSTQIAPRRPEDGRLQMG
jgi:hypothetical protein